MFEVVAELRRRTASNRWGLNWKRGNVGDLSQDIVTYYAGPEGARDAQQQQRPHLRHHRWPLRWPAIAVLGRPDRRHPGGRRDRPLDVGPDLRDQPRFRDARDRQRRVAVPGVPDRTQERRSSANTGAYGTQDGDRSRGASRRRAPRSRFNCVGFWQIPSVVQHSAFGIRHSGIHGSTLPVMIVRPDDDSWLLIRQPDHAAMAADLLSPWQADGLPDRASRDVVLLEPTREHDCGWADEDDAPSVESGERRAVGFHPPADRSDVRPCGCARCACSRTGRTSRRWSRTMPSPRMRGTTANPHGGTSSRIDEPGARQPRRRPRPRVTAGVTFDSFLKRLRVAARGRPDLARAVSRLAGSVRTRLLQGRARRRDT